QTKSAEWALTTRAVFIRPMSSDFSTESTGLLVCPQTNSRSNGAGSNARSDEGSHWQSCEAALRPFAGEQRFHFLTDANRRGVLVEIDIRLYHDCSGPDVPLEPHTMCEADWERAFLQASRGGNELAVDRKAALA